MKAFALLLVLGTTACRHQTDTPATPEITAIAKGKTYNDLGEYLLDAQDLVQIFVSNAKDISGQYRISAGGYIALPQAGMVRAKGLTELQLKDALVFKLRPHINGPRVSVAVIEADSASFYISGRVEKPGVYPLRAKTHLTQALAMAGGFRDAKVKSVTIIREGVDGIKRRYESRLESSIPAGLDNISLERGDCIVIE